MKNELNGYVIYCKDSDKETPLGVVSDSYDCQAISDYVPTRIKKFVVEIEDKRFYNHNGIDFKGVSRAIVENIKAGRIVQGGSTISQQLARNIIRDTSKTVTRKIIETIKAIQIENQYSKDEILNQYFNNVYFGKNIWGLRAAGLYYFGKEIEKLTQTEIEVDSETGSVSIKPTEKTEDPLSVWKARYIVKAIGRGFNPEIALKLTSDEMILDIINLPDYVGKSKKAILRQKGRIIGKDGRTRDIITEMTGVNLSVYGKTVALIGDLQHIQVAREAVDMILNGARHKSVYAFLEKKSREMKMEEFKEIAKDERTLPK
jgi:ribosomal RNA assembly protein